MSYHVPLGNVYDCVHCFSCSTAYTELGDGQLTEILSQHLLQSSAESSSSEALVVFKDAIEHSTRICRILVSCKHNIKPTRFVIVTLLFL